MNCHCVILVHHTVPPSIIAVSSSVSQSVNTSATVYCLFSGYPIPTVVWWKDAAPLTNDSTISVTTQLVMSALGSHLLDQLNVTYTGNAKVVSVLQLIGLQRADNGNYACQATNSMTTTGTYNATSATISIIVLGKL